MRVLIQTPWKNAWIPYYTKVFEERGHSVRVAHDDKELIKADVYLHMWACMTLPKQDAVNLMFLRRFEFFDYHWQTYDWSQIDRLIFCNTFLYREFNNFFKYKVPTALVYNAVDTSSWTFRPRNKGMKIGMACHIHPKKNIPLALQILAALGNPYELHIAGAVQDLCTLAYMQRMVFDKKLKVKLYGHVEDMDAWWEDKDYCLSTSLSEGNPNNVLEAMAKGIRPVVHDWPGASDQFPPECVFNRVFEAAGQIAGDYGSGYREHVQKHYSLDNFRDVVKLSENLFKQKQGEKNEEREQESDC